MSNNCSRFLFVVPMLVLIAMNHTPSHAQDEMDSETVQEESLDELDEVVAVEEIIVTANHRQEMLQDVPLSIAAFTESFFKNTGLTDFKALEQ